MHWSSASTSSPPCSPHAEEGCLMSKALKIVGALLGLVVLAFAGVFVFLLTLDVEKWKPTIAAQVKAATGRDLEIKGKISPQVSWTPTLAVEGVSLANAPWAE
ncbi:MAG: AsmA family protein, partial [Alphaproteobacteria bacterium]|nr:AsmA family protein [Alphaproteobacteria bacterium]